VKIEKKSLSAYWKWIGVGSSVVAITFLIYYTESVKLPFFATFRYLYLIPISYVALNFGRRYGLALSFLVSSLFLPLFGVVLIREGWQSVDTVEMGVTLALFNVLAALGGDMAEREVLQKERLPHAQPPGRAVQPRDGRGGTDARDPDRGAARAPRRKRRAMAVPIKRRKVSAYCPRRPFPVLLWRTPLHPRFLSHWPNGCWRTICCCTVKIPR
jgi:hypothetical protein